MGVVAVVVVLILGILPILVLSSLLRAWALSYLWVWFVTPIFGLTVPTFGLLYGFSMIVSYMTHQYVKSPKESSDEWYSPFLAAFIGPFLSVGIGWIVKTYWA